MSNPASEPKLSDIKGLLERLEQLPSNSGTSRRGNDGNPRIVPAAHVQYSEAAAYSDGRALAPDYGAGGQVRPRPPVVSPWLFVMATALNTIVAAVLAVLITLGVVKQDVKVESVDPARGLAVPGTETAAARGPDAPAVPAMVAAAAREAGTPPVTRNVELIPIGSREEPLRLEPLKPARFPLRMQPEDAARDTFFLVLSGLPPGSSVTGTSRISSDTWLLTPGSIGNLEIMLPDWWASVIEVGVELRRTNSAIAARTTAWLLVPPPALAEGKAVKTDEVAAKQLMSRADVLLKRGDVVAARTVYERAAELGSAEAALALGATYDPNRLWFLGVLGMVGNTERARQWYTRADQLGHPDAKEWMKALGG